MQPSLQVMASLLVLLAVGGCRREPEAAAARQALPQVAPNALRALESFAAIESSEERSRALFLEASRVLLHPRCANCHPAGDVPLHGTDGQPHNPPVVRGPEDKGVVGMECTSCHQDRNLEHARVPGAPNWHLAPIEMAWVGKSPRHICEQLKDPKRNGGKTLAQIIEHNAHDELVGWGWKPGWGREPAPGTQEQFGAIVAAWVETGAECPSEEARP
ncbi:Isoquinoline 1-oxidoreductase subunit [Pyxidicoccus trucidator]|uniref:Isoquinoline 1-oxidoreductase subunit n=1 Tax=Pyxidicoccus trucidator TaxID=2709662 RepID=UPI0013DCBAB5|nr:Isoquinoline 1-oxidoreductase subunit [Pyxidicoccus trucidator]